MARKKKLQLTKEGLEQLRKELKDRQTVIRKKLQDQLDEDISEGDLTENTSYYRVQEEIGSNEKRIDELQNMIHNATIVKEDEKNKPDVVQIGNSVTLEVHGKQVSYQVVGSTEANPTKNKVSVDSPLGKALLGKKVGEEAVVKTPLGAQKYAILSVD